MTPLMRQYFSIKNEFSEEIVLFQVGDFYEIFFDDAKKAAPILGIVLTQRGVTTDNMPIPLCGFPRHTLDTYLAKLVQHGFKVIICDQQQQTDQGKIIERSIKQVITPGTLTDTQLLPAKTSVYIATVCFKENTCGLLIFELLTEKLYATTAPITNIQVIESILSRFLPSEIIVAEDGVNEALLLKKFSFAKSIVAIKDQTTFSAWYNTYLKEHTQECSASLYHALQLFHAYFFKNNPIVLQKHLSLSLYESETYLIIDMSTQRHLELIKNNYDTTADGTLFEVIDNAITPMGSRKLKQWLLHPLTSKHAIEKRLSAVQLFYEHLTIKNHCIQLLKEIGDIERIVGRIRLQRAQWNDLVRMSKIFSPVALLIQILKFPELAEYTEQLKDAYESCKDLQTILQASLYDHEDNLYLIKSGYNDELDRLRSLVHDSNQLILALESEEQIKTGISSLKIRFSGPHGYGIEITRPHLHLVPSHYIRTQTLVNRERFVTQELKDLEYDIRQSKNNSEFLEKELYEQIRTKAEKYGSMLAQIASVLSTIDAFIGLAETAYMYRYTKPQFVDSRDFIIKNGRHPIIERKMIKENKGSFVANDLIFNSQQRLWIITGPNMGGKSTFLRQSALCIILAQMGSFVPAEKAELPIFDRIFTRIGSADHLIEGKSTFFVEMEETALICTHATEKSLIILDEVGRGTDAHEGRAIATAIIEYISHTIKASCLFATHYRDLASLQNSALGIASYYATSTMIDSQFILLHQIKPGVAQGSYAVPISKMVGLPTKIIENIESLLKNSNSI